MLAPVSLSGTILMPSYHLPRCLSRFVVERARGTLPLCSGGGGSFNEQGEGGGQSGGVGCGAAVAWRRQRQQQLPSGGGVVKP